MRALEAVQQLDPPGVGARDLTEALCIEMRFLGIEEPLLERIIKEHLDDVAANHFRKVGAVACASTRTRSAGLSRSCAP